jgi:hypothetical protein
MKGLGENAGEYGCVSVGLTEYGQVGAGLGGGFENTQELHVMKYKEAMKTPDKPDWIKGVNEEHERFKKHKCFKAVPRAEVPKGSKILTSTWAMKKKASGIFRARLNTGGYEQVPGKHYDPNSIAAPVTSDVTIHIVLTLLLLARWYAELIDVKGAFLHGEFEEGETLYMEIPEGFEQYYPAGFIWLLLRTIYGLKQAAVAFWKQLILAFASMNYSRSKADPCLYFNWTIDGLIVWISWVDGCLVAGKKKGVLIAKGQMTARFDCEEIGEVGEYAGCKVERNYEENSIKLTQPVMLQSFVDGPSTKYPSNTWQRFGEG